MAVDFSGIGLGDDYAWLAEQGRQRPVERPQPNGPMSTLWGVECRRDDVAPATNRRLTDLVAA